MPTPNVVGDGGADFLTGYSTQDFSLGADMGAESKEGGG